MNRSFVMLIVLASVTMAAAQETVRIVAPTQAVPREGCVTSQCHANVKDYAVVHGPVNVNACDACHVLTDEATHRFDLLRVGAESCTFCHKMDFEGAKVMHEPLKTGDCLGCHDPHGGYDKFTLRGASMRDTCSKCHEDVLADKRIVHGPVAAGACGVCHTPHISDNENLLVTKGRDLCLNCHTDMNEQLKQVKFKHEAVQQDCVSCHDPHASNFTMMVKQAPVELCTSCHESVKESALSATHKHSVVVQGDACLHCHTAHGGDLAMLMKTEPIKVCMTCHNNPIMDGATQVVAAVSEVLDTGKIMHGPIRDGSCGGCHNVHGSNVGKLLAQPYPEKFYSTFQTENYALCFNCHDHQLVLLSKTDKLTNFRNGHVNLHYMHVNKQKGRTCRACHSTHASDREVHIRESVPFGNWELPINFRQTATGGSCAPGCHQELGYDRDNPLPAASVAGAEKPAEESSP